MSHVVVDSTAPLWALDLARQINQALDTLPVKLPVKTVATVPSASGNIHRLIEVTNGDAGSRCLALSDGTNWKRVVLGANISTT